MTTDALDPLTGGLCAQLCGICFCTYDDNSIYSQNCPSCPVSTFLAGSISMTESGAKFQQRSSHQQAVHRSRVITPNVTTMNFFKDLDRRGLFASTGVVTQKQTQLNGTLQEKSQLFFFFSFLFFKQSLILEFSRHLNKKRTMDESENKHTLLLIRARLRVCASSNHQQKLFESAPCQKEQTRNNSRNSIFLRRCHRLLNTFTCAASSAFLRLDGSTAQPSL